MEKIAYFLIFGKPVIMYLGIISILGIITTAYIGLETMKNPGKLPISRHLWLARISVLFCILHAILAATLYF